MGRATPARAFEDGVDCVSVALNGGRGVIEFQPDGASDPVRATAVNWIVI